MFFDTFCDTTHFLSMATHGAAVKKISMGPKHNCSTHFNTEGRSNGWQDDCDLKPIYGKYFCCWFFSYGYLTCFFFTIMTPFVRSFLLVFVWSHSWVLKMKARKSPIHSQHDVTTSYLLLCLILFRLAVSVVHQDGSDWPNSYTHVVKWHYCASSNGQWLLRWVRNFI